MYGYHRVIASRPGPAFRDMTLKILMYIFKTLLQAVRTAQAGNRVISSGVSDYMDERRILDHLLNSIEDDSIHDGRRNLAQRDIHHAMSSSRGLLQGVQFMIPITDRRPYCSDELTTVLQ